jgi:membrane-associated phospholipid phosphatase
VDWTWFKDVHSFEQQTSWLHGVMKLDAKYGIAILALLILIGYFMARRAADALRRVSLDVWSALAALVAVALVQPISHAVDRARPFVAHPSIHPLIKHAADPGFPSDHATAAGAVAVVLFFVSWRLGVIAALFALLLAFSRVYVGVHYPGDVAGGLALGAVVALLGVVVVVPLLRWIAEWLARTPLRPLVAARTVRLPYH